MTTAPEIHYLSITVEAARLDDRILITWPELELVVHGDSIPDALRNMAQAVLDMGEAELRRAIAEATA